MGLMGVQLRIALKNEIPEEFELADGQESKETALPPQETASSIQNEATATNKVSSSEKEQPAKELTAEGTTNG
jgi:hypothetical protein